MDVVYRTGGPLLGWETRDPGRPDEPVFLSPLRVKAPAQTSFWVPDCTIPVVVGGLRVYSRTADAVAELCV